MKPLLFRGNSNCYGDYGTLKKFDFFLIITKITAVLMDLNDAFIGIGIGLSRTIFRRYNEVY